MKGTSIGSAAAQLVVNTDSVFDAALGRQFEC